MYGWYIKTLELLTKELLQKQHILTFGVSNENNQLIITQIKNDSSKAEF